MKFLVPLGLIALSSIIVLIILYIIRPKYRDVTVSSTYIWKLSLKYLKKKRNPKWLRNSLLLILQILILAALSFMLARPYTSAREKSGEKIIIIDGSASMLAGSGASSRFERAIKDVKNMTGIEALEDPLTVIYAGSSVIAPVYRETAPGTIRDSLEGLTATEGSGSVTGALDLAAGILETVPSADVYLYTDTGYVDSGDVEVRDVSEGEWNVSVRGLNAELTNGYYVFSSEILNTGRGGTVDAVLYIDGEKAASKKLNLSKGETYALEFGQPDGVKVYEFSEAYVELDAADSLDIDNVSYVFGSARRREIELVSSYALIPSVALASDALNSVFQLDPNNAAPYTSGYDMYIFEKVLPDVLPQDGGLLLIDPGSSGLGLTLGEEVSGEFTVSVSAGSGRFTDGTGLENVNVTKYRRLASYEGFEVLATAGGDPVLITKTAGNIQFTVLLFDIHYSDMPARASLPLLLKKINDCSAPKVLEKQLYTVGEQVVYNTKPNCVSTSVSFAGPSEAGNGAQTELSVFNAGPVSFMPEKAGLYTFTQTLSTGKVRTDSFYVDIPAGESDFDRSGGIIVFEKQGNAGNDPVSRREWFFFLSLALMALIVIEWLVQYREQI